MCNTYRSSVHSSFLIYEEGIKRVPLCILSAIHTALWTLSFFAPQPESWDCAGRLPPLVCFITGASLSYSKRGFGAINE
ncbi:hypothetical protein HMPREF3293_01542 [Christensenella minuta]|uniref:Uncharacterized protein n=1 Tax=Christensenella minuta TaxID=626937 RepID=A0A136Q4K5_9FIRM|nr:hypothetical protein HMPREF3293_01542 [Christensenella minuta]